MKEELVKMLPELDSSLYKTFGFKEYLEMLEDKPEVTRSAYQRVCDMIAYFNKDKSSLLGEEAAYDLFKDPFRNGKDEVFGLEDELREMISIFQAGAKRYGPERRIILIYGPVGCAKSTVVKLIKKGLEVYSRKPEGALYSFSLKSKEGWKSCPIQEEPLHLIYTDLISENKDLPRRFLREINPRLGEEFVVEGNLCPSCRKVLRQLLREDYKGENIVDFLDKNVKVSRVIISEIDRVGISVVKPRRTGKRKDAREFEERELGDDFENSILFGNRGIVEFMEMLQIDRLLLRDLLSASQEKQVKVGGFGLVDVDLVMIGHTNNKEYEKIQRSEEYRGIASRITPIPIRYLLKVSNEVKIYERDYGKEGVINKHKDPRALEALSAWAVLTRLEDFKEGDLIHRLKLYNGERIFGSKNRAEEELKKFRIKYPKDGLSGVSPRFIQDKISVCLASRLFGEEKERQCVLASHFFEEVKRSLYDSSKFENEKERSHYLELLKIIEENEYPKMQEKDVEAALSFREERAKELFDQYIENVKAYVTGEKIKNKYTGADEEPDEKLMRRIEEGGGISEDKKDDFRRGARGILAKIGAFASEGRVFDYRSDEHLKLGIERVIAKEKKEAREKLRVLVTGGVPSKEAKAQIDSVREKMINDLGYCEVCAEVTLKKVAERWFERKQ